MPSPGEPLHVHHVGIVARDEAQIEAFRDALGLVEEARERIEKFNVTNIFLRCGGGTRLHFMLQERGMLRNFNRGQGGLHHIAFAVRDIERIQTEMSARGLQFLSPTPQKGIGNYHFNFVHPNVAGVNIEFIHDPGFRFGSG